MRTALIASSKTFFSPFCVRAEHSRYLTTEQEQVNTRKIARKQSVEYSPHGIDLLGSLDSLRVADGPHALLTKPLDSLGVVTQIKLSADQNNWNIRSMV